MPIAPLFTVDEREDAVVVTVTVKGVKKESVDVFITAVYLKVSAAPYLFQTDLKHRVDPSRCTHRLEASATQHGQANIIVTLTKETPGLVWEDLHSDLPKSELAARRDEAEKEASEAYNAKLENRKAQKEAEGKRYFHEHWDEEKKLRAVIEEKVEEEKTEERTKLYEWENSVEVQEQAARPAAPTVNSTNSKAIFDDIPAIRGGEETTQVVVELTPKTAALPARTRGDEDYYRRSRYKPQSVEDTPMFWKEKGDGFFKRREYKQSADAYSEAIKRDACFVSAVANRGACWLMMHNYDRCIDDCDLALTMVNNTPASETSGDRYRAALMKLYARRGAAYLWKGDYLPAQHDYQMAVAYRMDNSEHKELIEDLQMIQDKVKAAGLQQVNDPAVERRNAADAHYLKMEHEDALVIYEELLEKNPHDYKTLSNKTACLLHVGRFDDVLAGTETLIEFCNEIANAINSDDGTSGAGADVDSDDEDVAEGSQAVDDHVARRRAASQLVKERSGHVYLLLKAYVRRGAAFCGKQDYRSAYECFERALRITPYDDDLRQDTAIIAEKMRLGAVVDMTRASQSKK
eukprot:PhM_4_TR15282/c0_g1_i1/m.35768/K19758/DYX1C1, DNAAF4; dyslexia susceptibility 1 candidate gene 1 protein